MFPMKCMQCDVVVMRNEMPFHLREAHGPRRSNIAPAEPAPQPQPAVEPWERFRARQATPPPDVQEDRHSFKLGIQSIVREFNALSIQACEECCDNVEDMPVLGALYAYTFTHLKLCAPNNGSLLDELENLYARWVREGDECFLDLKNTKDALVRILAKSQVERHICNTRLINEHRLHDLDIDNIVALIVKHTTSREHIHAFYAMTGTKAQNMVDTLQNLLVLQSEGVNKYRRYLLNAIIRLSRKSGRFPQSLLLRHIQDLRETTFRGGYGLIYEGKLNDRVVAVKKAKDENIPLDQLKEFCNEAVVWRHVRHSNCLPFYGVYVLDEDKMCLVSPWMINGHVRDYLRENPSTDRLPLILDVACGLEYLHSMQPEIIHGDLKGANILITSSGRACLADFGIAVVRFSQVQMTTTFNLRGTRYFMAPELLRASMGSADDLRNLDRRRCDMYAFGCVCYEIYTGMDPIHNQLVANSRPQRPPDPRYVHQGLDDDMWSFMEKLWQENPTARRTAEDARKWISSRVRSQGKSDVRPSNEVEWDVGFLADAAVTMAAEDSFALACT